MLALLAQSVIGVDINPEAILTAERNYKIDKSSFLRASCTCLPLEDASVDVVVSFETLEHIEDHEGFMQEIKRVLSPGGLVVMSTPDRDVYQRLGQEANPFHLKELSLSEYQMLLSTHFNHTECARQKAFCGSVISPITAGEPLETFYKVSDWVFEHVPSLHLPPYICSVSSDADLGKITWSVLDDSRFLRELQVRVMAAEERVRLLELAAAT